MCVYRRVGVSGGVCGNCRPPHEFFTDIDARLSHFMIAPVWAKNPGRRWVNISYEPIEYSRNYAWLRETVCQTSRGTPAAEMPTAPAAEVPRLNVCDFANITEWTLWLSEILTVYRCKVIKYLIIVLSNRAMFTLCRCKFFGWTPVKANKIGGRTHWQHVHKEILIGYRRNVIKYIMFWLNHATSPLRSRKFSRVNSNEGQ